jgi:hypothetical protein
MVRVVDMEAARDRTVISLIDVPMKPGFGLVALPVEAAEVITIPLELEDSVFRLGVFRRNFHRIFHNSPLVPTTRPASVETAA